MAAERCAPPRQYQFELRNPHGWWKPGGYYPPCMARNLRDAMRKDAPDLKFRFRDRQTGEIVDPGEL